MIANEVQKLYDQVFHDLYSGDNFECSFDENILVWLRFKLEIESLLSGIDRSTFEFLNQYIEKAEREIIEIKQCKNEAENNPRVKKLWEHYFGKSK